MNSEVESKSQAGASGDQHGSKANPVFYYKDSGILERHGKVPFWLTLVLIALIWSIYYLIAYWTPPA